MEAEGPTKVEPGEFVYIKFGNYVKLIDDLVGTLQIYEKNPDYAIFEKRDNSNPHGQDPVWQILPVDKKNVGQYLTLNKEFYLYNIVRGKYLSDDKRKSSYGGFDGVDGYFGLTGESNATAFKFMGMNNQGGNNFFSTLIDSSVRLSLHPCQPTQWKSADKEVVVYPKNQVNYLVWDETKQSYHRPIFTVELTENPKASIFEKIIQDLSSYIPEEKGE